MKKSVLLLVFLCFFKFNYAQEQSNSLTGKIIDGKTKEAIEMATIQVLNARDSAYVTGGATNQKGEFKIPIAKGRYILHISYMGYKGKYINAGTLNNSNLGTILLGEDDVLLKEAIVEAKAIEIQVKGDTVEYNADSYKTQPSAVVEDLLKKMPGVEIDSEGKITINGKEIKKILVDGKEFFSDDPKVASKNLPASMINKLQVLDRKSDMSQMTGFDDGNDETVINLTVKPGMKQGVIGNGYAGYGKDDRYEVNANVNVMQNNSRLTFIGGTNNTNNAGFSDLASGMGGGGNRPRGISFGGNNGVAKTTTGGFDFATDYGNKFKWGGNIRYGSVDNDVQSSSFKKYTDKDPKNNREINSKSEGNNFGQNFNSSLRLEWSPDSLTKIIFSPNIQYNINTSNSFGDSKTIYNQDDLNESNSTGFEKYSSDGTSKRFNGTLDLSRKLNNKGRVISLSVSGGVSDGNSDGTSYSENIYYNTDKEELLDQQYNQKDKSHNWRAYVSYVEPLGNVLGGPNFLQATYSIKNSFSETNKNTYNNDGSGNYTLLDETYSSKVKNEFLNQNASLNIKAIRQKFNLTVGAGIEPYTSKTETYSEGEIIKIPTRNYINFSPNAQFNYIWDKRHTLRLDYSGSTNQASAMQLFDKKYNPSLDGYTIGNSDLKAGFEHSLRIRYMKSDPQSGSMIGFMGRGSYIMNDIVSKRNTIYIPDGSGKEIKIYENSFDNVDGTMNGMLRMFGNRPLPNKKFTINGMIMNSYKVSYSYIDSDKNKQNTYSNQENIGIKFNTESNSPYIKGFEFNTRINFGYKKSKNTLSKNNDQSVYDYGGFGSFTIYLPFDWTIDSDMNYTTNSGYQQGFKQNEWLWNASVAKQIFKNKAGTIRFKAYDILQQRSNISTNFSSESSTYTTSNSISSYFMVHFIYKLQLFKGVKREAMEDDMRPNYGGGQGQGRGHGGGGGRF